MAAAAGYASMEGYSNTEYPEICPAAGCVYGNISQNYLLRIYLKKIIYNDKPESFKQLANNI